jgi:hypothetical protein
MEEQKFRAFLKRGGRSASAASRVMALMREFEGYMEREQAQRLMTPVLTA